MTNEEYDKMFQVSKKSLAETPQTPKDAQMSEEIILKKLNLRTLKGAFIVLLMGFGLSLVAFLFERLRWDFEACGRGISYCYFGVISTVKGGGAFLWNTVIKKAINLLMFKYQWE